MKFTMLLRVYTVTVLLALQGCASMLGDKTVTVSQVQVQQKINEHVAVPLSILKLFEVNLSHPIVYFDAKAERIHASLDAKVSPVLFGTPFAGKANISGKLKFDPKTDKVLLTETKIDTLNFDGAAGKYADLIAVLGAKLGTELLQDIALYTLKPEDLKVGNTQFTPKLIRVTDTGLEVTLSPKF